MTYSFLFFYPAYLARAPLRLYVGEAGSDEAGVRAVGGREASATRHVAGGGARSI